MKLVIGEEELNKLVELGRTSFNEWMDEYEKVKKENEELKSKIFILENEIPAVVVDATEMAIELEQC